MASNSTTDEKIATAAPGVQPGARIDFRRASHTIVLSDVHLTEAEPAHPRKPLWKRFKRRDLFMDESFARFFERIQELALGEPGADGKSPRAPVELILNGDIFDFDAVLSMPKDPTFSISWLERARGLEAEEAKSRFKMEVILKDHQALCKAMREFVMRGNRIIFVIGNHDMELHWPAVQKALIEAVNLPQPKQDAIRFCEWFYISNGDTLIEHGNQYDPYCLSSNPIHPLIKKRSKIYVRLPFGNLANKYMMNGMGLFNPHVQSNYIMNFSEYVVFFYKNMLRTQPFLVWTWFWGAMTTLVKSIGEGLLPALKDPLTVETRVMQIAARANATPRMVRTLAELHVHPAIYDPLKVLRELWLDRALMFLFIFVLGFQFFALLSLFSSVSIYWSIIPIIILLPFFVFYARKIKSDVTESQDAIAHVAPTVSRLLKVKRVIQGHTHKEKHVWIEGAELLNTGSWSPAFHDLECTKPFGRKPFAWIHPPAAGAGTKRVAQLMEWRHPEIVTLTDEKGGDLVNEAGEPIRVGVVAGSLS